MKKSKADNESEKELLLKLKKLMQDKEYNLVDQLLKDNEHVIKGVTSRFEVPLVLAIKHWDAKLVEICIDRGADPGEQYKFSPDDKPTNPFLIAVDEFGNKIKENRSDESFSKNLAVYQEIMSHMTRVKQFKASGV